MSEWQPMETCPRDGTEFLAYKASTQCMVVCTWLEEDHPDYDGDTPHLTWDFSAFWDATHWMPLPKAPKK